VRADALARTVRRYRVMAYITGVVLIILCFVGIPLQVFAHNEFVVNYVGTTHGILYIIYLVTAYLMTRQVGLKLASPQTVIDPALAAARAADAQAASQSPAAQRPS